MLLSLHQQIEYALSHAPVVEPPTYEDCHNELYDLPDSATTTFSYTDLEKNDLLACVNSLTHLMEAYYDFVGSPVDREHVAYVEHHEKEHYEAAKMLGAASIVFGISLYFEENDAKNRMPGFGAWTWPVGLTTTKLGYALLLGYPSEPSPGDRQAVRASGYEGIEEIAEKAVRFNQASSGLMLPVPLSMKW